MILQQKEVKVSVLLKSCGNCVNDTDFGLPKIFSSLPSDVKGLSKKGGSMEPFNSRSAPALYFNHNHNNSVSKKVNKQEC